MRILTVAALAALLTLASACQDTEARMQNAKLQAELDNLKNKPANDDLTKLLLANRKDDSNEELKRTLNSISGDLDAGMKKLQKSQDEAASAQSKRIDELETKLKKVDELAASLLALKTMIETLESKVKNVDPNQVLDIQKKLLETESSLRAEQDARKRADTDLKAEQDKAKSLQAQIDQLNKDLAELKAGTNAKVNADLRDRLTKAEKERDDARSDRDSIKKQFDDLREQINKGNAKPEVGKPDGGQPEVPADGIYTFEGYVAVVGAATKPGGPNTVLVNPPKDAPANTIPPEGAELIVLDGKNNKVCLLKVKRIYFKKDDNTRVDQLGCETIDQKESNPVMKNYKAVWMKPKDAEASGK